MPWHKLVHISRGRCLPVRLEDLDPMVDPAFKVRKNNLNLDWKCSVSAWPDMILRCTAWTKGKGSPACRCLLLKLARTQVRSHTHTPILRC